MAWKGADPNADPPVEGAVAIENWEGACLSDYSATLLEQESIVQDYVTSTWTYAQAKISFSRIPTGFMTNYFLPAMLLVFMSYLGFYIDPAATPARVALGMLTMVVVMTNTVALTRLLPPSTTPSWLIRFMTVSFYFNIVAMTEQIMVSFGNSIKRWQDAQLKLLQAHQNWAEAFGDMARNKVKLTQLWAEWVVGGGNTITKVQFRDGVHDILGFLAPVAEINRLFAVIDVDASGSLTFDEVHDAAIEGRFHSFSMAAAVGRGGGGDADADRDAAEAEGIDAAEDAEAGQQAAPKSTTLMNTAKSPSSSNTQLVNPAKPPDRRWSSYAHTEKTQARARTPAGLFGCLCCLGYLLGRPMLGDNSVQLQRNYREGAARALKQGAVWKFKVFVLFPIVGNIRFLDQLFRVIFPIFYAAFILIHLSEVNFGRDHYALLETAACYRTALGLPELVTE